MSEREQLLEGRNALKAKMIKQSHKCRCISYLKLARYDAMLGDADSAIDNLRNSVASGLDTSHLDFMRTDPDLASLHVLPEFTALLASLDAAAAAPALTLAAGTYMYAKGEVERCTAESLLCALCSLPLEEPLLHVECGTMFCTACITPLPTCHQCSAPTQGALSKVPRFIVDKLKALKVHCPRCQSVTERASLAAHLTTCPVVCPHGCKQRIDPAGMDAHRLVCAAVEVGCSSADVGCEWRGARRDSAGHERKCPFEGARPVVLALLTRLEQERMIPYERLMALERRLMALEQEVRTKNAPRLPLQDKEDIL